MSHEEYLTVLAWFYLYFMTINLFLKMYWHSENKINASMFKSSTNTHTHTHTHTHTANDQLDKYELAITSL